MNTWVWVEELGQEIICELAGTLKLRSTRPEHYKALRLHNFRNLPKNHCTSCIYCYSQAPWGLVLVASPPQHSPWPQAIQAPTTHRKCQATQLIVSAACIVKPQMAPRLCMRPAPVQYNYIYYTCIYFNSLI